MFDQFNRLNLTLEFFCSSKSSLIALILYYKGKRYKINLSGIGKTPNKVDLFAIKRTRPGQEVTAHKELFQLLVLFKFVQQIRNKFASQKGKSEPAINVLEFICESNLAKFIVCLHNYTKHKLFLK